MGDWLKIGDLARIFQVDVKTAERWCKQGKVPGAFRTPGRQWRIPPDAVEKMILAGEREAT